LTNGDAKEQTRARARLEEYQKLNKERIEENYRRESAERTAGIMGVSAKAAIIPHPPGVIMRPVFPAPQPIKTNGSKQPMDEDTFVEDNTDMNDDDRRQARAFAVQLRSVKMKTAGGYHIHYDAHRAVEEALDGLFL